MKITTQRSSLYACMIGLMLAGTACSKDNTPPEKIDPPVVVTPVPVGTIHLQNNAPTPVRVYINGVAGKLLASGASMDVTGEPGASAFFSFEAFASDEFRNVVGMTITMNDQAIYPEDKQTIGKEINIPADYFFLRVINNQQLNTDEVIVNYQLNDETTSQITGTANKTTAFGYYLSDVSSWKTNIRLIRSKQSYMAFDFNNIKLPGIENQAVAVTIP